MTMDYKLALSLKDAGFPQETQWVYVDVGREWPPSLILRQPAYGGGIPTAAPTLEELIEACGTDFSSLHRVDENSQSALIDWKWEAITSPDDDNSDFYKGSTPIEAVANLWLALNKN